MVNVPLIQDKLAARLVLYEAEQGGYIDDVLLNKKDINDQHSTGGRLMLGFTPTDNLTINASGLFQKTTLDGQNSWYPALGAKDYSTNARTIAPTDDNLRVYNVTAKWDLGFATLTGTSSYYKWTLLRNSDYSPTLSANRANATSCRNYIAGGPAAPGHEPGMHPRPDDAVHDLCGQPYAGRAVPADGPDLVEPRTAGQRGAFRRQDRLDRRRLLRGPH
jgi:iron complex outermembrane receptor protein